MKRVAAAECLINLYLVKGKERYIFSFDPQNKTQILEAMQRFAADPELSFSYFDAAVLSKGVRQEVQRVEEE